MFNFNTPIWFYSSPVDFRKQIDGLVMFIADHLEMNPTGGQLFVFRNRGANKIKLLWYDSNGFWLCYKKLQKGKLKFPSQKDAAMELTSTQLSWLLSGLDFTRLKELPTVSATEFF
jgi:transposase